MALTAEVTPLEENRVRLDVAVPEDEVRRRMERAIRKVGSEVRVPGFRPGKAPAEVIVQRVGRDAIVQEMLRGSLGEWYSQAVAETGLKPIDDPDLDMDDVPEEGELTFKATVQVRPRATLGDYAGLEVGRAEPEVPDGELERQLEALRERAARLSPVERAAAPGDYLIIDFDGSVDGRRLKSASARDYLVELGGGRLVPEFERHLTGLSAGGSATFAVAYPDTDQREDLRGREVGYTATVKAVQEKELPELDDELAIGVSEHDTLDALRDDIRTRLEDAAESEVSELFRRMVIDAVAERSTVDVPAVMVDQRIGSILQATAQQLPEGVSFQDYLDATGRDLEEIVSELRPDAEMAVRRELVVEAVADAEGIEVGDDEVEARIRADAETTGRAPDRLVKDVRKHATAWEDLRHDLRMKGAMDRLVAAASPIPMAQAEARERLWTPDDARKGTARAAGDPAEPAGKPATAGKLWTPGDPR